MRRVAALLAVAALPLPALAAQPRAVPPALSSSPAELSFAKLGTAYLDGLAQISPVYATQLGDHRFDSELPDMGPGGRATRTAFSRDMLVRLGALDRTKLPPQQQVDAALLENALRYDIWDAETLQSWAWDPQVYNDAAGSALYGLASRDFAPWPARLRAAIGRMEKLPALLAQARASLVPARVPPIHAQTVARQNEGLNDIIDGMFVPHLGELPPIDQSRFRAAADRLRKAVAEHQRWLDTVLVPGAKGNFRLGATLYDQKLAFALNSPLGRDEIKRRAQTALTATRAEMYSIARTVLTGKPGAPALPDTPTEAQQQTAIEAALELSYQHRPARGAVIATAEAALARATAFVRSVNLVSVPETPLKIIPMPRFQQGVAIAYCDSPGPLDRNLGTFYAVSPIPAEWSEVQATSFLREYNDYMIDDVTVHEAMPGHYLQLAHANAGQSPLRAVLASGSFIEGWAVYAEGQMSDAGYRKDDPLFRLTMLKMRLRSISNALLDIAIQTEGMDHDAAIRLMTRSAFQQEREAEGKWTRARLTSAQLPTYFVGYSEHIELRRDAEAKAGVAFDRKAYHDALLATGSPPVRYARALMFGEAVR
jgi:uncharacterized protein (DUF885 family)